MMPWALAGNTAQTSTKPANKAVVAKARRLPR